MSNSCKIKKMFFLQNLQKKGPILQKREHRLTFQLGVMLVSVPKSSKYYCRKNHEISQIFHFQHFNLGH